MLGTAEREQSSLADKRVLVTGATGLVGGYVVEELLRCRAEPIALVRDDVRESYFEKRGLDRRCTVVRGDITDLPTMLRIINEYQIQVIFHLAAQTQVRVSNDHPLTTWKANIEGTWNILEAARQCPKHLQCIITASSDKAYGEPITKEYGEDHPLRATFPYDVSKACADLVSQSYAATYRLPICVTRCGNFFGPGDLNWDRLVPHVIQSFLNGKSPQLRSDGSLVRDYFFVRDGAAAYLFLAEKMLSENFQYTGHAFNFSYGLHYSVTELVAIIARLMGTVDIKPKVLNNAPHEISFQCLSSEKAKTALGWRPLHTLESGLEETIAWYRERCS